MDKKLQKNYTELKDFSKKHQAKLIAVSKTKPVEAIQALYALGQRVFGENIVQEMVEKQAQLPQDIEWHLIGHLQSNKVKYIAPFIHTIQSVDSIKLLDEIEKQAAKHNRKINCLLQIDISGEETKFGFDFVELVEALAEVDFAKYPHILFAGVMGIASNTDKEVVIKGDFNDLKNHFTALKQSYFKNRPEFKEISMGMSSDYELACSEGSTMIRVGSLLFGSR